MSEGATDWPTRSAPVTWLLGSLINSLGASWLVPNPLRTRLLAWWGVRTHPSARMLAGCVVRTPQLTMSERTYIHTGCIIDNVAPVSFGPDSGLSMGCVLVTTGHVHGDGDRRAGAVTAAPITIGRATWIGARVVVLPGVTIGEGCIVGAGSVVTKDLEPHGIYAGVPARRIADA